MNRLLEAEMPEHVFLKLLKMKNVQGFTDTDWSDFFTHLTSEITLDDTPEEIIQRNTRVNMLKTWSQNFAENLPHIRSGHMIRDLVPPEAESNPMHIAGPAIVVGRGPSLFAKKHLELLAEKRFKGTVIATDGALIECLKRGVVPQFSVSVDGNREKIREWYAHPLVKEHGSDIKAVLCVTVAHNVWEACRDAGVEVYWFNPQFDDFRRNESFTKLQMLMTSTDKYPNGAANVSCGGNCGGASFVLATSLLHCSPTGLVGLDLGYLEDTPLEETAYYNVMMQGTGNNVEAVKQVFEKIWNPYFKCFAKVDMVFKQYRDSFLSLLQATPPWIETWNLSEGGTLFTEDKSLNLKYATLAEFLEKHAI